MTMEEERWRPSRRRGKAEEGAGEERGQVGGEGREGAEAGGLWTEREGRQGVTEGGKRLRKRRGGREGISGERKVRLEKRKV